MFNLVLEDRDRAEGGTELHQNGSTLPTRELDLCQSQPLKSQTNLNSV